MTTRLKWSLKTSAWATVLTEVPWVWWNWAVFKAEPALFIAVVVGGLLAFVLCYYVFWSRHRKRLQATAIEIYNRNAEIEAADMRNRLEVAKAASISGGMAIGNVDDEGHLTIQVHKLPGTKSGDSELLS